MLRGFFLFLILALGSSVYAGDTSKIVFTDFYQYALDVNYPIYDYLLEIRCTDFYYDPSREYMNGALEHFIQNGSPIALLCRIENKTERLLEVPKFSFRYKIGNETYQLNRLIPSSENNDGMMYYFSAEMASVLIFYIPEVDRKEKITLMIAQYQDDIFKVIDSTPLTLNPLPTIYYPNP